MRPLTVHTLISAPREEVFDFVGDLANRVAYADHYLKRFHLTRPTSRGNGAAARFCVEAPLARSWAELAIVDYDRPRRIVEEGGFGRRGRNRVGAIHEFLHEGPGATRVELTVWTEPARRIDALREALGARRWLTRQSKTALERLRMVFEEPPQAPLARATVAAYEPSTAVRFGG